MPSVDERNAAFDAVKKKLDAIERTMPGMFVGYVDQYLGRDKLLDMVDAALVAAEAVRAKHA